MFITIRAYKDQIPFVEPRLNRLMLEVLNEEQERCRCAVFTYFLIPDHIHFLVRSMADGNSVLEFTSQYKGKTTNRGWAMGWHGKLRQARYCDHIVRRAEDLTEIAQYILNNFVRKGLSSCPEDWPWSGHFNVLPR